MRLLFSLTYYTPYISGLTLYVKRLGEALVKNGYSVTVLTMNFDKRCRSAEIVNGVKIVRANYLVKINKGFLSLDWLVRSWREVRKADVVFVSLPQFEGLVPALFAKFLSKKVVSIYNCEVDLPAGLFNSFVKWFLNLSHLITLQLSHKIITYTKDFADHSKLLPSFRGKLSFVYPPILAPKINKSTQKILKQKISLRPGLKGVKGRAFIIGVAARLAAEKGIEYVLESIPILNSKFKIQNSKLQFKSQNYQKAIKTPRGWPNGLPRGGGIRIVIAGSLDPVGEESYKRKILKLTEKYKDYVVFLGELTEEDMGSFYSLIDVLVLSSVNSTEAFGMVQVEAMMMGAPVVASDLPGVRIPIKKTGMGKLVLIKNSQKLAEAIVEILRDKKRFIKDTSLIKKEFSIEKTIEFYEDLLKR